MTNIEVKLTDAQPVNIKVDGYTSQTVKAEVERLEERVETIITTPVPTGEIIAQEIIDARQGKASIGANITEVKAQLAESTQQQNEKTKSHLSLSKFSKRPMVSFIDDDGYIEVFEDLYPLFREKGVPGNAAIITGKIGNAGLMSNEHLKTLTNEGWELLGHGDTYNSNLTEFATEKALGEDLIKCRDTLLTISPYVSGFVYPQSAYNNMIRQQVLNYFDYSFGDVGFNSEVTDPSKILRVPFGYFWTGGPTVNGVPPSNTFNYYKECVDHAKSNNMWLVFMLHAWDRVNTNLNILSELIDYIKGQSVDIVTTRKAYEIFGPKIYIPNFDNGSFMLDDNSVAHKRSNTINQTTGIGSIDKNNVYYTYINSVRAISEGWPDLSPGALITNAVSTYYYYNSQEYIVVNTNKKWVRYPISDTEWSPWELANNNFLKQDITPSTGINSFLKRGISRTYISGVRATSEGWPGGLAGSVTTDRISELTEYNVQEYRHINCPRKWVRYPISDTEWSPWEQLVSNQVKAGITLTTPIDNFEFGSIYHSFVGGTQATSEGWPEGVSGKVITDRISKYWYWNYQEYHLYAANKIYRRVPLSDTTWGAWKAITIQT